MNALFKILDPHERFRAARDATLIDRYWYAFDHFRQRWETIVEIVYQRMFHRQAEAVMKVLETYEMFSGAGFDESEHPRGKTTQPSTPGSFAPKDYIPSVTIAPAMGRAYKGKTEELQTELSKSQVGKLSEDIIIAYLRSLGFKDAGRLNVERNNFPIDIIHDHNLVEVKGGMVSNGPSALHWRMTIGEPAPIEKARIAKMGKSEKQQWHAEKQKQILKRKMDMVRAYSKHLGQKVEGRTMTVIIHPDKGKADIFSFKGFHQRIGWKSQEAKNAYVTTVSYRMKQ